MGTRIDVSKPEQPKCPNGHAANSNGNCTNPNCVYRNDKRHDAIGDN